jgi:hypothetical protein
MSKAFNFTQANPGLNHAQNEQCDTAILLIKIRILGCELSTHAQVSPQNRVISVFPSDWNAVNGTPAFPVLWGLMHIWHWDLGDFF